MQHTQKKIEWDTLSSEEKSNENPKKNVGKEILLSREKFFHYVVGT